MIYMTIPPYLAILAQTVLQYADAALGLLFSRAIYSGFALAVLSGLIIAARPKLAPSARSFLWGLCALAIIVPFERGIIALAGTLTAGDIPPAAVILNLPFVSELSQIFTQPFWKYIWLAGMLFFAVRNRLDFKRTIRDIKRGRIEGCAAYFYKGKSRIYTPRDFTEEYTEREREMLLAHERQHVAQRDPFLYRFLQAVQCVFWFLPIIHKAARLVRQDRELLCDERVTRCCSKRDYGALLLNAARKASAGRAVAGIVSEPSGMAERVTACIKPFPTGLKPAVFALCAALVMFTCGAAGFAAPVCESPMTVTAYVGDFEDNAFVYGAEDFISVSPEGFTIDQTGLYGHLLSLGFDPSERMTVNTITITRSTIAGSYSIGSGVSFKISELASGNMQYESFGGGLDAWRFLLNLI